MAVPTADPPQALALDEIVADWSVAPRSFGSKLWLYVTVGVSCTK